MSASSKNALVIYPEEVSAISIWVDKHVRSLMTGEHKSVFSSTQGFEFVGIKEFEPGDPAHRIDWAKSANTGFHPLLVREFVEEKSIDVVLCADASLSTRCGLRGSLIGTSIARVLATVGFSAAMFQDRVGLVSFGAAHNIRERPRGGKDHVTHLIEQYAVLEAASLAPFDIREEILRISRGYSLVVVISDFLFEHAYAMLAQLAKLLGNRDIAVVMVESDFAFSSRVSSAGWIRVADAERGERAHLLSRDGFRRLTEAVHRHQQAVMEAARKAGIPILRAPLDKDELQVALADFFFAKRLKQHR